MIEAIRERVPAYRRPMRGRFGAGIRTGVEEALGQFVDLIADPSLDRSGAERVYRGLGRGEHRERRSLDALLAAYRLGARVAWRRVAVIAIEAGVDRRTWRSSPRRCSPTSTSSRRSRPRATRRSSRSPPARASAVAAG